MRYYPATLEQYSENGESYFVGVLRITDDNTAVIQAENGSDAMDELISALIGVVEFCIKNNEPFPPPLPRKKGEIEIALPSLVEIKMLIHNERLAQQLTKTELGKMAGFTPAEMQRLLNPWYKSGLDKLDRLCQALGKSLILTVR